LIIYNNTEYDSYDNTNTHMNVSESIYNPNTVYHANNVDDGCTLTVTELHGVPEGEENAEGGNEEQEGYEGQEEQEEQEK